MADSSLDLLALNREILLNPRAAGTNELVALLELEKPGLEFLCPMARAIYWMETNRPDRIDANEVLGSLWLIDESEARGTGEFGDDFADVSEVVHHSIIAAFGGVEIDLGFESSATMVHYREFWPEYLRVVSAQIVEGRPSTGQFCLIKQWFDCLDEDVTESRGSPSGYPTDSGEFIGTCRYTLTSINGLSVDAPTFSDTYHEQDWEGLSGNYPQRWDGEEENSSFCWLHYLSPEQAEQIGIAAKGKESLGPDQDYPAWVPKLLVADLGDQWIHSDQISESYGNGAVVIAPSIEAWIAVGCGAAWEPADDEGELNPDGSMSCDEFSETMGPVLKIEVKREMNDLPEQLQALLPYWLKLYDLR
ncbi:MAG: hypothetical protein EBS08_06675 [Cytophagia bacterium]|jgi:hypothetical protein|nr:hypothetical protein [Cytophagia bacterium]